MSLVFDLLERLAPLPRRFDQNLARSTIPDFIKESTNRKHVVECAARYIEWKTEISDLRIDVAKLTRLVWVLVALSVAGNTDMLAKIAAFIAN